MTRPSLAGLRVLTVSQFGAGPFGTQVLADLGADIIKIEDPTVGGDIARYVPPFRGERDSLYFQSFNRGKKSLADEQVRQREMILEVAHPRFGVLREVASPIKTAGAVRAPAPAPGFGEHTDRLLSDLLHYPHERIAALRAADVLGDVGPEAPAS